MKNKDKKEYINHKIVKRCSPDATIGLSAEQVTKRIDAGAVNVQNKGMTPTVSGIILKNTCTLFNFINVFLAVTIILVGHIENILFLGVAVCNTIMGIFQELRAKRGLDKLSILVKSHVTVVRDGKEISISHDELVLDDIVLITAGNQICADAVVITSERLEIDESLLTGESDRILKVMGDTILSGSYATSGRAYTRVTAVGEDNYAHSLTTEAKKSKKRTPQLLRTLNRTIMFLTIVIIPLGTILFCTKHILGEEAIDSAILSTSASVLGMIPSGLILLTGVSMSVGALKLARRKALVQALPSIETLARIDILCLDKTGTITDGSLMFEQIDLCNNMLSDAAKVVISELMGALEDTNTTAIALTDAFGKTKNWTAETAIPFSSERKWSGVTFIDKGSYILGAPNIVFANYETDFIEQANTIAAEGFRVLCLAYSSHPLIDDNLPKELECLALLILSDHIRENAIETFRYFANEDVTIKVISGDNPHTVSAVASKAGLTGAEKCINMSTLGSDTDYAKIAEEYTVFGHVTPQQKRALIQGLKINGHTVCMTGDGVNDLLAMRESDCSVAMVGGSDAARTACDFVLMSDDFSTMIDVLKEGRRVINNIEKVAAIFLLKTVYSVMLTLIYIFIPYPYPIVPLQMMPINELTVGIPAFFIALQTNYARPTKQMLSNILEHTLPAAVTVVFNTLYIQIASILFDIPIAEYSTMIVFLIGIVGIYLLLQLSKPYTKHIKLMLAVLVCSFILSFTFIGNLFILTSLFTRNVFFYLPLVYFSYHVHSFLAKVCRKGVDAYRILKDAGWIRRKVHE